MTIEQNYYLALPWRVAYACLAAVSLLAGIGILLAGISFWSATPCLLGVLAGGRFLMGSKGEPVIHIAANGITYSTGPIHSPNFIPASDMVDITRHKRGVEVKLSNQTTVIIATGLLSSHDKTHAKEAIMSWFASLQTKATNSQLSAQEL
ncbi:hypothetical protein [Gynuella sunshinyii]|uniref:Uncharacterized protein n=1 Tax=Gynuella sunshinyii YC6258 TaxID=1445510 RepID=A0A0C5W5Q7_9GAMM|nr:hypothetical protein [Gynuella sunshinyii]AJQ97939.1 hypothetical Protein YC6258_05915 [Gynuella sunshinyii YC6258]